MRRIVPRVAECMDARSADIAPWALERYTSLYGGELPSFLECMARPPDPCVRINTLRSSAESVYSLFDREGITYRRIGKDVGACVQDAPFSLSSMPAHLMGHFYIQGLAEMAVAPQLAPKEDSLVWDMCSAPGGKTTHLSQIMDSTGCILATDVAKEKLQAVCSNTARMGCTNTVVIQADARTWRPPRAPDSILLDAPCTGSGTMRKDPSRRYSRTIKDVMFMQGIQKGLMTQAAAVLAEGGRLLYSTCSLEPEENECIVDWALDSLPLSILPLGKSIVDITPGYTTPLGMNLSDNVARSGRVEPHRNDSNGMFMALFEKRGLP